MKQISVVLLVFTLLSCRDKQLNSLFKLTEESMNKERLEYFKGLSIASIDFDSIEAIPFYKATEIQPSLKDDVIVFIESKGMYFDDHISYYFLGYKFHLYLNKKELSDELIFGMIKKK